MASRSAAAAALSPSRSPQTAGGGAGEIFDQRPQVRGGGHGRGVQEVGNQRRDGRAPGNPPAGERADQIAAAADRFCRLGRLVPGIEQHTLPAGEDLRECQRAFPPGLSCGRDDAAVDSGHDTRRGSQARAGRCRHLPHRFPIVSGPLREVEELLDEGRSGAGRCWRRRGSARTEQRRVDRVGDDTRQGASSRPREDGAEALLFEWSRGCVDERVQQDDAQAQERERQTGLPRGFDPLLHVGADLFDLSERAERVGQLAMGAREQARIGHLFGESQGIACRPQRRGGIAFLAQDARSEHQRSAPDRRF